MIITCPQCLTKFDLAKKFTSGERVKVRCSKCRHVFGLSSPAGQAPVEASRRFVREALVARRRRRRLTLEAIPVALLVSAVFVLGAWGLWGSPLSQKGGELLSAGTRYLGLTGEREGAFALQNVKGYFVENSQSAKLFIIEGQAVNQMKEPRSFLRVRGTLLDARGAKVEEKMVYCGNILAERDLQEMDGEAIARSLSSQFGESLSNMNIDPNQSVPFMIVFTDLRSSPNGSPPGEEPGAKAPSDFLVEVVDSQTGSK